MSNRFCQNQERVFVTNYNGILQARIICNCSPDKRKCPYDKEKKAKNKCQEFRKVND